MRASTLVLIIAVSTAPACSKSSKDKSDQPGPTPTRRIEPTDAEATEVTRNLEDIADAARDYQRGKGRYPVGKVGLTPARSCCKNGDGRCNVMDAEWTDPVWQALAFKPFGTFRFQYSYESADGMTFTATAATYPACDGMPITYQVFGRFVAGNAVLDEPAQVRL